MFDGEIVKKKFPYKKILDGETFWPRQSPKTVQGRFQNSPNQIWM